MLADTERDGHLPAFNQTFAEFGLPMHWSHEEYGRAADRRRQGAAGDGVHARCSSSRERLPSDPDGQRELLAAWHKRKTAHYTELVEAGVLPARPGIARIVEEAAARGLAARGRVDVGRGVRACRARARRRRRPGRATSPSSPATSCPPRSRRPTSTCSRCEQLGIGPDDGVVVEDSGNGLRAALAAGLRTVVTVSSYTADEDFTGASLVVTVAGRPRTTRRTVLADPYGTQPRRRGPTSPTSSTSLTESEHRRDP